MATTNIVSPEQRLVLDLNRVANEKFGGNTSEIARRCGTISQPTVWRVLEDPAGRPWASVREVVVALELDVPTYEELHYHASNAVPTGRRGETPWSLHTPSHLGKRHRSFSLAGAVA